jgi:TRAP-type C4-dicarboxylate transport system substrate-binding protein
VRKLVYMIVVAALAISLGVIGCAGGGGGGGGGGGANRTEIALSLVTFWPSVDFQAKGDVAKYGYTDMGHQAYMNRISERVLSETTDYKVTWTAYYAGTVSAAAIYAAVANGTYDIGCTGTGYSPGVFPLHEVFNLPGNITRPNAYIMSLAKRDTEASSSALQAEFTARNLKLLHLWSVGPGWFLMTPGHNVTKLDDFEGKTIRAATPGSVCAITHLGGTPLQCSMDEAKQKFEANLLQGILCPTDTPEGFGLGAYVREATFAPCTYDFVFIKVMNPTKYNSLPASVKAILDDVDSKWPDYYGKLRTWGELHGLNYCRTLSGWWEYNLPTEDPDEYALWAAAVQPCVDDFIGGDSAKQALWDYYKSRCEYYATTPPYSTWTPSTAPPTPP